MQVFTYKCVLFVVFLFKKSQPALRQEQNSNHHSWDLPDWISSVNPSKAGASPTMQEAEPSKSVAAAFQAEQIPQFPAFSGLDDLFKR